MELIVRSLLDIDFYKFTMGQFVFLNYPDVRVKYAFRNRTKAVEIAKAVDLNELHAELEAARRLRFTNTDLHYLRGTNEYGERMFQEPYLEFLRGFALPEFNLERNGGDLTLEFEGRWAEAIYWETIALAVVSELYYRRHLAAESRFGRDAIYAEGRIRLAEKIRRLRECPDITFTDFGTRRRFSYAWQRYVVEILAEELPKQFLGTSNVRMAADFGLLPMGTNAHELAMVLAGIMGDSDEGLRSAQEHVLDLWWKLYGWGLSIALPDTFGSDFFFRIFGSERAREWKGMRHDSGDPIKFGEELVKFYAVHGVDAREKLLIFSDGQTVDSIIACAARFRGHIKTSFGWGTNLMNDLGLDPISIIVKPVEANGRGLVKISDNLAKATGRPEDVERAKRAFGYTGTTYQECVY